MAVYFGKVVSPEFGVSIDSIRLSFNGCRISSSVHLVADALYLAMEIRNAIGTYCGFPIGCYVTNSRRENWLSTLFAFDFIVLYGAFCVWPRIVRLAGPYCRLHRYIHAGYIDQVAWSGASKFLFRNFLFWSLGTDRKKKRRQPYNGVCRVAEWCGAIVIDFYLPLASRQPTSRSTLETVFCIDEDACITRVCFSSISVSLLVPCYHG